MNPFRKLAGDTAIYGMSSIVGRFLNWWLVPYYTMIFSPDVYGVVTNLYSYVALFLVLLLYGMETSFFRFASKNSNSEIVYSTSLISIFSTSLFFVLLVVLFKNEIASLIQYPQNPEYITWLAIIIAIDAFTAIPFARLRLNNRPIKFATIKVINILFNIGFNIFFLTVCPRLIANNPDSMVNLIYSPNIGVGYVFISNLLASIIIFTLLIPEVFKVKIEFNRRLLLDMLNYGFPILIVGLAGMINQNIDKILIPFLLTEDKQPMYQLGVYGANFKLAVLMNMFIQAFRYAFEPFFFSRDNSHNDKIVYATVMNYFVIFGLIIFLGMTLFIDIVMLVIGSGYHEGLKVVPLILMANLFFGIYFTLSLWYKLKDMTRYGAYMALTGAAITVTLNVTLIPLIGYMGSAIALFVSFFVMMVMSYLWGRKYYPIPYDLKKIGIYFTVAAVIYVISLFLVNQPPLIKFPVNIILFSSFLLTAWRFEKDQFI